MKLSKEKFETKSWYKFGKFILTSAPFALLLSIAFFWYQTYAGNKESEKMVGNLRTIEQSLSTRHIGIFPDYLNAINRLLAETPISHKDTAKIVIFESTLFYGAFYNGSEFKEMMHQLSELSNKGKRISIAYYDNSNDRRKNKMFRETVQESWIQQKDLRKLSQERRILMDSLRQHKVEGRNNARTADSIVNEKYFALYRSENKKEFTTKIATMCVPLYNAANNDFSVFQRIDEIKNTYLNKPVNDITYTDIFNVHQQTTDILKIFLENHNIKLIPLNDYMVMSCWSNGEKALFAFPGKYAADEIGFISHDAAILRYINTMLDGIENISDENN